MIHTAGRWDPKEPHCYFIASEMGALERGAECHDHLLVAINDLKSEDETLIKRWCDLGKRVFIDSGVFNLANSHARDHGITMDQALSLAPDDIDGFDALFDRYVGMMKAMGSDVWGYVEIDQGGRANKIKTRARLEAMGLRPIPVYHPLNDGWDYFDELASQYDRICFGNIVQAERRTRVRLLATAAERRKKYPGLWIHLLGMTPHPWLTAFPVNSCDSSTWLRAVRWSSPHTSACALQPFMKLGRGYAYSFDAEPAAPSGYHRAHRLSGYEARMLLCNWRAIDRDYSDGGLDLQCQTSPQRSSSASPQPASTAGQTHPSGAPISPTAIATRSTSRPGSAQTTTTGKSSSTTRSTSPARRSAKASSDRKAASSWPARSPKK